MSAAAAGGGAGGALAGQSGSRSNPQSTLGNDEQPEINTLVELIVTVSEAIKDRKTDSWTVEVVRGELAVKGGAVASYTPQAMMAHSTLSVQRQTTMGGLSEEDQNEIYNPLL